MRVKLVSLAMIGCTIVVLGWLLYRQWDTVAAHNWQIDWRWIGVAFGVLLAGLLLAAWAWVLIMRELGSRLPVGLHIRYYVLTHVARRIPGVLWYVAGRGYFYQQHGEPLSLVAIGSALEFGLITVAGGIVTLALWSTLAASANRWMIYAMIGIVALGLIVTQPVVLRWLLRRLRRTDVPLLSQKTVWLGCLLFVITWLLGGLMFFALLKALTDVSSDQLAFVVGAWCLVGTLSAVVLFLPTSLGFNEIGLSLLLSTIMPSSLAVVVTVVVRIASTLFDVVAAGFVIGGLHLLAQRGIGQATPRNPTVPTNNTTNDVLPD